MKTPTWPARGWPRWLPSLFALGVLALLGRVLLVSLFADSVPYWDEWDAEGANLIKPWLEGTLTPAMLIEPHNEHRILFTRLLSLGLLEANGGQWDNRVSAYANTLLHVGQYVLVYALMARGLPRRLHRAVLATALLATAWLPFGYTNALIGFQNQFFVMALFAVATIAWAASGADRARTPMAVAVLALAGLFTLASGLLAAVAAGGVLVLRAWLRQMQPARAAIGTAVLVGVTLLGLWLLPHLAGHDALRADGLRSWARVFALNAGWPFGPAGAVLVWAPFAVTAWRVLRRREADAHDLLGLGLGAWVLLQCAAIAYSRGGETSIVGRYVDTLALGLVLNTWLALRLASTASGTAPSMPGASTAAALSAAPAHRGGMLTLLAIAYAGLVFGRLAWQAPDDLARARAMRGQAQIQTANVRRFVATGVAGTLVQPFQEIPYPQAQRLAQLLTDPTLHATLPASVRLPLFPARQAGNFATGEDDRELPYSSCLAPACGAAQGEWRGEFVSDRYARVQLRHRDGGDGAGLSIRVEDAASGQVLAQRAIGAGDVFRVPTGRRFRVVVSDASSTAWVAVAPPVEIGPLSAAAVVLQERVRALAAHAWAPARPERIEVSALNLGAAPTPLKIAPGAPQHVRIQSRRGGLLDAASLALGTYGGRADGVLAVKVCTRAGCQTGRSALADVPDNTFLTVALQSPLAVASGESIAVSFGTEQATHPVAVWAYPLQPGSPRLEGGPEAGRLSPRIELRHVD